MQLKINHHTLTAEESPNGDPDEYFVYYEVNDVDCDELHFLGVLKGEKELEKFFDSWKLLDIDRQD